LQRSGDNVGTISISYQQMETNLEIARLKLEEQRNNDMAL
jgi:hypothetical protein